LNFAPAKRQTDAMKDHRPTILEHMLPLVPFTGWTEHTLAQAGKDSGLESAPIHYAFPGGIKDVIDYFFRCADENLAEACPETELSTLRMPGRIEKIILTRLQQWLPHREAVRRFVAARLLPWNKFAACQSLYRTVDLMWKLAGDNSTNFSFYTKRMTLAAVYSSTLLFWLNDASDNQTDTREFLERRLQNVADFGRWKKKMAG